MIKSELIQRVADRFPHLYQKDIDRVLSAILDEIADALARQDRVELRGFGTFTAKGRVARSGRNPRTGGSIAVSEKFVPSFRLGKDMLDRLNGW